MPTNVHNSCFSQERISVQHSLGRDKNSMESSNISLNVEKKIFLLIFKRLISRSILFIKHLKTVLKTMETIMLNLARTLCSTVHAITKTLYNMLSGELLTLINSLRDKIVEKQICIHSRFNMIFGTITIASSFNMILKTRGLIFVICTTRNLK